MKVIHEREFGIDVSGESDEQRAGEAPAEPNVEPSIEPAVTVVGGAGFLGSAVVDACLALGREVASLDRALGRYTSVDGVTPIQADLLTDDLDAIALPEGRLILAAGASYPRVVRPWQLVLDNALATARLARLLTDRDVTLVSSVEVYGTAPAPLGASTPQELPLDEAALRRWAQQALVLAEQPCPPWRAERACRQLSDADPGGRWVYALAKRAQELIVSEVVPAHRLRVVRVANLFGHGQDRVVAKLVRRALAGLPLRVTDTRRTFVAVEDVARVLAASTPAPGVLNAGTGVLSLVDLAALVLDELGCRGDVEVVPAPPDDAAGVVDVSAFRRLANVDGDHLEASLRAFVRGLAEGAVAPAGPPIPVVVPPRPEQPSLVAERIQQSLWTGCLKGGPWTSALTEELRGRLDLPAGYEVVPTASGTAALRLATVAVAGRGRPGDVAVLPSFTFPATGEFLVQLGYRLRFCDVRPDTWTLDAERLEAALAPGDVRVVVVVDALGAPADYDAVRAVCQRHGVPLVADSAPSLGARYRGRPVGSQADAHAFSMSFAKVVSAAGAGGAVVLPTHAVESLANPPGWSRSTPLGEVPAAAALDLVLQLDRLVERREAVARVYAELDQVDARVVPQHVVPGDRHAWVHWVARFTSVDRDRLAKKLDSLGIGTKPYYAPVLHHLRWRGAAEPARRLAVTEGLHSQALALPMSSEISQGEAERVFWSVLRAMDEIGECPR